MTGMGHCVGGYGPLPNGNQWPPRAMNPHQDTSEGRGTGALPESASDPDHDFFAALERWTEKMIVPEKVIGSQRLPYGKVLTRPVCV